VEIMAVLLEAFPNTASRPAIDILAPGRAVNGNSVSRPALDVHICRIRRAIEGGRFVIVTERGMGFRLESASDS